MDIPEIIKLLAGNETHNDIKIYQAEVVDRDSESRSSRVRTISGPEVIFEASLMAEIGNGFLIYPKIGSIVYVLVNPTMNPFIIHYGEIDAVVINADITIELTTGQNLMLNGDDYGGLVQVDVLRYKLNLLEARVNGVQDVLNIHTHGVAGEVTTVSNQFMSDPPLELTKVEDLENPNVKHGPAK